MEALIDRMDLMVVIFFSVIIIGLPVFYLMAVVHKWAQTKARARAWEKAYATLPEWMRRAT